MIGRHSGERQRHTDRAVVEHDRVPLVEVVQPSIGRVRRAGPRIECGARRGLAGVGEVSVDPVPQLPRVVHDQMMADVDVRGERTVYRVRRRQ